MKPQTTFLFRIVICIAAVALTLYAQIDTINDLTALRLAIPLIEKDVRNLRQENERLQYEIDRFESPIHLMELSRRPEYGHLRHPRLDEVVVMPPENGEGL